MYRHQLGFTLVELVLVLLVASILAISAGTKFFRADDAKLVQVTDHTLALLRQIQLTSMQDTAGLNTRCPTLIFSQTTIAMATNAACSVNPNFVVSADDASQNQLGDVQLQLVATTGAVPLPQWVRFDGWGRPLGVCAQGCEFRLGSAGEQRRVCLSAQGYIALCS